MASVTGADRPRKKIQRKRLPVAPYFTALLLVLAILWVSALAGSGWKFPTPKLGLDLQGGLSMTLTAYQQGSDEPPSAETMEQARQIIESRVNSTGVAEPEVFVEGTENIVVNVAGDDIDEQALRDVGAPAELRFRIVTNSVADTSALEDALAEETPAEEPTDEGAETPTAESSEAPAEDASATPTDEATEEAPGSGQAAGTDDVSPTLDDVWAKVGPDAAAAAQALTAAPDESTLPLLEPFGELTPEEVSLLPAPVQFYVPQISCEQLDNRPPGAVQQPDIEVTACSAPESAAAEDPTLTFSYKYLLQPATVLGSDVTSADVGNDQANLNQFVVNVQFSAEGAEKWGALTTENLQSQVAIVLDNEVVSAPTIREVSTNSTQISGDFSADEANQLADQLNFGSLPTTFVVETVNEVTATLGVDQLEAGLLAMLFGLILVFLYCMVYYRLMGFLVLGSLLAATVVLYPTVALLGSQIGLTLTLAGIAGFVVAIGITADSFIVYFERIKEEMAGGRSSRSAVPRAWVRTRRTILSAAAVSMLSAIVLYILAIGPVRAFAFALGLSTLVDVMVVFLFTHPIAEWLTRGNLLNKPRLSGLHTKTAPATGDAAAKG
ncbi:protein translocase subunit SecD [Glycomyces sp. TRM65418]|uniref:protein translocase subunit SecD n=1 Tax=Glycomyces sp. TRM65418 TaxID=2867006 RepID=UPI001CE536E7|nr:protein translocase subunit SecD [Glycomyces sp. TRM65418]MCC3761678.1 protein translocase subunit SecD [Glycomyces sp. TRM65418]QZD55772.1 protein translocase subunit SecD [Glycomyces sp. TRM65418]